MKILLLLPALLIFSCSSDDSAKNTSISGRWQGTFNIPVGEYTPDGDFGTITFETEEFDSEFYGLRGTIVSNVYGEYEHGAITGGSIEKNESDQWEYSGAATFQLFDPVGEVYFFDGIIQNNSVEGIVRTTFAPNGTFSLSKD